MIVDVATQKSFAYGEVSQKFIETCNMSFCFFFPAQTSYLAANRSSFQLFQLRLNDKVENPCGDEEKDQDV